MLSGEGEGEEERMMVGREGRERKNERTKDRKIDRTKETKTTKTTKATKDRCNVQTYHAFFVLGVAKRLSAVANKAGCKTSPKKKHGKGE
jgi:hypothetical protein